MIILYSAAQAILDFGNSPVAVSRLPDLQTYAMAPRLIRFPEKEFYLFLPVNLTVPLLLPKRRIFIFFISWTGKMAQPVKVLDGKPEDLSSIPRSYIMEEACPPHLSHGMNTHTINR